MTGKRIVALFCFMALVVAGPAFAGSSLISVGGVVSKATPEVEAELIAVPDDIDTQQAIALDWNARSVIRNQGVTFTQLQAGQTYTFWIRFRTLDNFPNVSYNGDLRDNRIEATFTLLGVNGATPVMKFGTATGTHVFRFLLTDAHRFLNGMGARFTVPADTKSGNLILRTSVRIIGPNFTNTDNVVDLPFSVVGR